MIDSKEIGDVLKSLDCTMEYDIARSSYTLRLNEAPAWTIEISALETLQNHTEVALLDLITSRVASLRTKYKEDMKNYMDREPRNREVYFVGGPMNGKSLVLNNGAPVYQAAMMSSMVDMTSSPSNFVTMDDVCKHYLYDIVRSQYGTEITYYGIGQEHNKNILAAFRAQTDLLKRIQDDDPYWELRLRTNPCKEVVMDRPAKEYNPPRMSAWDKKLKEELANGDDTWGSIARKYGK